MLNQSLIKTFAQFGRKANQFSESYLKEMLLPKGRDYGHFKLTRGQDSFTADFHKSKDGETLTFTATIEKDGKTHTSEMVAHRVNHPNAKDMYQIDILFFDNKPEPMDRRYEIISVLSYIGQKQYKQATKGKIPAPHKEKGEFGKWGRRWNRMQPDFLMAPPF